MTRHILLHLTIPAVVASTLLFTVAVGAAWYVNHLQERASRAVRENTSAMRAAEELEILAHVLRTHLQHFGTSGGRQRLETMRGIQWDMGRWLAEAERWSFTPDEHRLMTRARQGYEKLRAEMERITENPKSVAQQDYERLDELLTQDIVAPTHEFLDLNEDEVEKSVVDNESSTNRLVFGLLLVGACGCGAGLAAGFVLAHRFIERLLRSERAALRAEQLAALGHLAAAMAHELRNPVTAIKVLVQAALTKYGFDASQEGHSLQEPVLTGRDLTVVEEEITRLEGLVQSFLDFAGPPVPERRVVDVYSLVERTLELIAGRAAAGGVIVELDRPVNSIRVAVDPGQFRQLVLNLVVNALDAVKPGGRIKVRICQEQDGKLVLSVADNGSGLPAALGPRIFDPFTTTKDGGLGLGLSICKRIVEGHDGVITATNAPVGGAEFIVRIPAMGSDGK